MNSEYLAQDEPEISLTDIIDFFVEYWRWLLIGLVIGGVGISGYQGVWGKYTAKGTLINNCNNAGGVCAIDFVGWQYLEKELSLLASKQAKGAPEAMGSLPLDEIELPVSSEDPGTVDPVLFPLSSPVFWKKHITPIFVISKDDVKNLAMPGFPGARRGASTPGQSEGDALSSAATSVIGLSINFAGKSKDLARQNAHKAMNFIVDGAAFIYCEGLIKSYTSELEQGRARIQRDLAKARVDLTYQERWITHLYKMVDLHPKTLNEAGSVVQLGNKTELMSLETQIVVAENDLEHMKANLSRLTDQQGELEILDHFVQKASPLLSGTPKGQSVVEHFLSVTGELKQTPAPEEEVKLAALGRIESDITAIKVRFNQGFSEGKISVSRSLVKPTLLGMLGGGFLALISAIGNRVFRRYRAQKNLVNIGA